MSDINEVRLQRKYLPKELEIQTISDVNPFVEELLDRKPESVSALENWLRDISELESVCEEEMAWRYIRMTCDTEDKKIAEVFHYFVREIEPYLEKASNQFDQRLLESPYLKELDTDRYHVLLRAVRRKTELFREENVEIRAALQELESRYGAISGAMTIMYEGEEMTLQKASNYLKETDRNVRKEVYELIQKRKEADREKLHDLLDQLIEKRHTMAVNAGFANYRDFKHQEMERFDYTIDDVKGFHESVMKEVSPVLSEMHRKRKDMMGLSELMPYDLDVDPQMKPPLKPFVTDEELINHSVEAFRQIDPAFGDYLAVMRDNNYLDLGSRKGKAPGGYNYPLYESNVPFIFMNATGNQRDLETMMHEGGHAVHSFLSSGHDLVADKSLSSEIAELASMSMELISMDQWHLFYSDTEDLKRAKMKQLQSLISVLPWVAIVDKFQHWLYTNYPHTHAEREQAWGAIQKEFASQEVTWGQYEKYRMTLWQSQLHIYEVPFYYIEYGIAQLGAVAMWKQYKENPRKALSSYKKALSLGYTKTIPEIYEAAGIRFDFSQSYIKELMDFVLGEIELL